GPSGRPSPAPLTSAVAGLVHVEAGPAARSRYVSTGPALWALRDSADDLSTAISTKTQTVNTVKIGIATTRHHPNSSAKCTTFRTTGLASRRCNAWTKLGLEEFMCLRLPGFYTPAKPTWCWLELPSST